jgi:STE24 endopeptidase
MDAGRKKLAKKYEKIKLIVGLSQSFVSFTLLFLFVAAGLSKQLELFVLSQSQNPYIALLLFVVIIGVVAAVLSFPVDYFFGFRLEHEFGLSNLTFGGWLKENLKSIAVGIVLVLPLLFTFYFLLFTFEFWWLWFACLIFLYSVVLTQIAPVVIFPLFYKFTPIENESLKLRIEELCSSAGFKVKGVYSFNMSKTTKKANAALTGLGKTKRIILGDTLLSGFSEDEIVTVFAHELGHYKKSHIKKNILISTITTFAGLYLISVAYSALFKKFGFQHPYDLGALPLLAILASLLGFLLKPFSSFVSRKFEFEADRFALKTTGNPAAFESMLGKLAFQNLADDEPNKFVEFWFHSHPSIRRRIQSVCHSERSEEFPQSVRKTL